MKDNSDFTHIPRVLLAGVSSGSGKTVITCGILQALLDEGRRVASFKAGPDYIDPMFHSRVIGAKSRNLDPFFTDREVTRYLLAKNSKGMDISVLEGVMGYYDGLGGCSVEASTYDLAQKTNTPVILIVNCKGLSVSAAAIVKGFLEYQEDSKIKAVILNQVSPMIYTGLKAKIEGELGVHVLGYVPQIQGLKIESRHLGLISPDEILDIRQQIKMFAEALKKTVSIPELLSLAEEAADLEIVPPKLPDKVKAGVRIAVARDEAFSFYYEDNLQLLRDLGAELIPFSPLRDEALPGSINGLLLGGGYPELYAKELSKNIHMRNHLKQAIQEGLPCLAECGGFLYLQDSLEDMEKKFHKMAGLFEGRGFRTGHLGRFGYVTLEAKKDCILGKAGTKIPAHEFHYWDCEQTGTDFKAVKPVRNVSWDCIHADKNLLAGFPHLYFYGNPACAHEFLLHCESKKYG